MDGTVFTALVSGVVALGVVALTNFYSRKRDHEADWRKKKLEHCIEFIAAFSRAAREGSDLTAQLRYLDAENSLALVASTDVLNALNDFHDASISGKTDDFEALHGSLMRAMRKDCHPKDPKDDSDLRFTRIDLRTIVARREREQI